MFKFRYRKKVETRNTVPQICRKKDAGRVKMAQVTYDCHNMWKKGEEQDMESVKQLISYKHKTAYSHMPQSLKSRLAMSAQQSTFKQRALMSAESHTVYSLHTSNIKKKAVWWIQLPQHLLSWQQCTVDCDWRYSPSDHHCHVWHEGFPGAHITK